MATPALHPERRRNFHHLRGRYPCLTEGEARAAAAIYYDGPRTEAGERLTAGGLLPGSEANWRGTVAPGAADTSSPGALAFDAAALARLEDSRRLYDATATDLAPFFACGGRLLVWHGLADQDITPRSTLAWWHALRRDQGRSAWTRRPGSSWSPASPTAAAARRGSPSSTR
jgi:feruloyl esterase